MARHYSQLGFDIVARNFRFKGGELDVVASHGNLVVVCEVKARMNERYGSPAEAVTLDKQMRIRRGAIVFIRDQGMSGVRLRFDVASVLGTKLELITDAF